MKVRAYFWEDRIVSPLQFRLRKALGRSPYNYFLVGNAGDILARDLIAQEYACRAHNDRLRGKRLLLVGSVGHRILHGDFVCGIGVKTRDIPRATEARVRVWAVRGPLSFDTFKAAGHDVSDVKFQLDPGLIMGFITHGVDDVQPSGAAFIPHYRERGKYVNHLPRGIRMIDIDNRPQEVARAILGAELIYSSSLHGIIFAHALNRPCILVAPQTAEPMLKYEDYFASVSVPTPKPLASIFDAKLLGAPVSPATIRYEESDFLWPDLDQLESNGIALR